MMRTVSGMTAMALALLAAPATSQTSAAPAAATAVPAGDCAGLAGRLGTDMQVEATTVVAADAAAGLPAHCRVDVTLSAGPGSRIGTVVRLPRDWNGKLLGLGGGGWAGNVTPAAAAAYLMAGYAVAQTDGGHAGTSPWDTRWALAAEGGANRAALEDFSHRAVHLTAVAAKRIVAAFYGQPQRRAYFQGCSTGGRMALMEAQRYPEDYDGIIAGAPVYTLRTQTTGLLRQLAGQRPGAALSPAQFGRIEHAVLDACDGLDGVRDGIVGDPRACRWDPAALQCPGKGAAGGACLTPVQVAMVRSLYDGIRTKDGRWSAYPVARGSEAQWASWFFSNSDAAGGGLADLRGPLTGDPAFVLASFDPDRDQARVEGGDFARMYEAADPDIRRFAARGGRLILWHGFYDAGPSPVGTIEYHAAVGKVLPDADDHVRLFMAPGVGHCRGGPGVDRFDMVGALDAWIERGEAPVRLTASRADGPMTRPLCRFPMLPHYDGKGNPNDAASFVCR